MKINIIYEFYDLKFLPTLSEQFIKNIIFILVEPPWLFFYPSIFGVRDYGLSWDVCIRINKYRFFKIYFQDHYLSKKNSNILRNKHLFRFLIKNEYKLKH